MGSREHLTTSPISTCICPFLCFSHPVANGFLGPGLVWKHLLVLQTPRVPPGIDSLLSLPCHNKLYGISKSFPQTCPIYHCSLYSSYGDRCCLTFFLFSQGQWDNLETEIKSTGTKARRSNGLPARISL